MKRNLLIIGAALLFLTTPVWAATYTVTNCADSGAGSLRQSLTAASTGDEIIFDITTLEAGYSTGEVGPGLVTNEAGSDWWFRIVLSSALPTISADSILVRGSTQTREATNTLGPSVEVRANGAFNVFEVTGNYATIEGLVMNRINYNNGHGIYLYGSDYSHVYGCYIGTSTSGEAAPNTNDIGIWIRDNANYNKIGDGTAAGRNIISGNSQHGIDIYDSSSNEVIGNYIGLERDGATGLGNVWHGIYIHVGAKYNKIGNSTTGGRNIISSNFLNGIYIRDAGSDGNEIYGNFIGTDATGTADRGNGQRGIYIYTGPKGNKIGDGTAAGGNIISGNNNHGVEIDGDNLAIGTNSNEVLGNHIGTDVNGTSAIANTQYGIYIRNGAKFNKIGNGTAGGGNIISGNGLWGILFNATNTNSNEVFGNFIGVQSDGTSALPNSAGGVSIYVNPEFNRIGSNEALKRNIISGHSGSNDIGVSISYASNNIIEGNWIGLGTDESVVANFVGTSISGTSQSNQIISNVISGNSSSGIYIQDSTVSSNEVTGNYIGTDSTGTIDKGNNYGIYIYNGPRYNKIGNGTTAGRNIISGNDNNGITIISAESNEISGNYIGTDVNGSADLGNTLVGIALTGGSQNNIIGGSTAGAGNIISGNESHGIFISGTNTSSNEVENNFIGTNASGTAALTNESRGIYISSGANYTTVSDNVVSGNKEDGIFIIDSTTAYNRMLGNLIGTSSNGASAVPNGNAAGNAGIFISDSHHNYIGDATVSGRNIISGNIGRGIAISGTNANSNEVSGNYIGTDINGTADLGNSTMGIQISGGAKFNRIGDGTSNGKNVICKNSYGIYLTSADTDSNQILKNYIGVDATGTTTLENSNHGIFINNGPQYNRIADGNIISGNGEAGISFFNDNASTATNSNEVTGNFIGTDAGSTLNLGNGRYGIDLSCPTNGSAQYNIIGASNIIAYNGSIANQDGIRLNGANVDHIQITQNSIFSNYGKGILLVSGANSGIASPEIITADYNGITTQTLISGEGAPANGTVEVFKAQGDEGKTYLESTTADGSGNWSISISGLATGEVVTATGTTANPRTSEFSLTREVVNGIIEQYQPDNLIATLEAGTDYVGEGIFNLDGTNQTRTRSIGTGESATYYIKIENDANTADEITVKGIGSNSSWALTYFDAKTGGTDITSNITGSGWSTGTLASGESKEIRMVVANSGSTISTLEALVTSESVTDSGKKDAVKAATTATPLPTDLTSFDVSGPATAVTGSPFSLTIIALNSTGSVETNVIGTTRLLVDEGTITPESIAESGFVDGTWSGDVILSKLGARTVTASNEGATGTAQIVITNATLEITSSGVTITVPSGASSEEVNVSVSIITDPPGDPPPGYYIGGDLFDIISTPTEFLLPVTVTIPIDGPLTDPRVSYWNGSAWSSEGINVISFTAASLTFTTTHFTVFAPMAALSSNLVRFGPNPYNPNSGQNAKIWYWLERDYDTSIYVVDMTGTLVWKNSYNFGNNGAKAGANSIDFDGRDQWGNVLGDGVYLYKIVQNNKSIGGGKIAIIK